jgi:glycosyltransferase involved in cell wall biosynthesis
MTLPLSVYYITLNEELRLPESLAKVASWADEIIVVDSGSTDRTREIAEAAGARFVHNDWEGFACQKAFAASLCRNDWVLDLDADEVLSDRLVGIIKERFSKPLESDIAGFRMRWVLSQPDPRHPFRHDKSKKILRLYNRPAAGKVRPGSGSGRRCAASHSDFTGADGAQVLPVVLGTGPVYGGKGAKDFQRAAVCGVSSEVSQILPAAPADTERLVWAECCNHGGQSQFYATGQGEGASDAGGAG